MRIQCRATRTRELSTLLRGLALAAPLVAGCGSSGSKATSADASVDHGSSSDTGLSSPETGQASPDTGQGPVPECNTQTEALAYVSSCDAGSLPEAGNSSRAATCNDAGADCVPCSGPLGTTGDAGCVLGTADAGGPVVECTYTVCEVGRRYEGLEPASFGGQSGQSALGRMFAAAAYLEDASVTSFGILARELEHHGAPARLTALAKESARDEVRHAREMGALARRYGSSFTPAPKPRGRRARSLPRVAYENAVEGCVRETYGALVATYQASNARDPMVRAAMARIAKDETRHASLAWKIRAWADGRLGARARRSLARRYAHAVDTLLAELSREPDAILVREAGVPRAKEAQRLLRELTAALRDAA